MFKFCAFTNKPKTYNLFFLSLVTYYYNQLFCEMKIFDRKEKSEKSINISPF